MSAPFDFDDYVRQELGWPIRSHAISCVKNKARITSRTQLVDVLRAVRQEAVTIADAARYFDANLEYASNSILEWAARAAPAQILEEAKPRVRAVNTRGIKWGFGEQEPTEGVPRLVAGVHCVAFDLPEDVKAGDTVYVLNVAPGQKIKMINRPYSIGGRRMQFVAEISD